MICESLMVDPELHGLGEAQAHAVGGEPEDAEAAIAGTGISRAISSTVSTLGSARIFGGRTMSSQAGLGEDGFVEEADAVAIELAGAPGASIDEPLEVGVQFLRGEVIRAAADGVGETVDRTPVGLDVLVGLPWRFKTRPHGFGLSS
jgi:hypothetical protein